MAAFVRVAAGHHRRLGIGCPGDFLATVCAAQRQHDLGLGIVFGSNILNLAALLGLSAVLPGKVQVSRRTLYLNGGVAVGVMALTTAQLYGTLSLLVSVVLIAPIMARCSNSFVTSILGS